MVMGAGSREVWPPSNELAQINWFGLRPWVPSHQSLSPGVSIGVLVPKRNKSPWRERLSEQWIAQTSFSAGEIARGLAQVLPLSKDRASIGTNAFNPRAGNTMKVQTTS